MCAGMAGVRLYEARGTIDYDADGQAQHALHWQKRQSKRMMREIAAGVVVLTADLKADITNENTAPRAISIELED